MVVECCSQERTYSNFYGLIGERLCKINKVWLDNFQEAFQTYYETIHRYETNKLRNIARFFGHLLASDAISWAVLHVVHMNEEETTSSSRIFVKIALNEMKEELGLKKLAERLKFPDLQPAFAGLFPTDNPRNTRFAINFYTQIGLGAVTEDMRTWLQNAPKLLAEQHAAQQDDSSDSDSSISSSESELSDSTTDYSSDDSRYNRRRRRSSSGSRSPPPRRRYSSDDSPPRRRRYSSESVSPPPKRREDDSPPRRRAATPPTPPARRDVSPPRRGDSPPPRRRDSPPPRRRESPPGRRGSPPPRDAPARVRDDSPPRRREDRSPPRRRYDDRDRDYDRRR